MVQDQTLEETPEKEPKKTAGDMEKSLEETPKQTVEQPEVDYKTKFVASQQEALRLKKELDAKQKAPEEDKVAPKETPDLTAIVQKEVRAQIAPLTEAQEKAKVDDFLARNPDAATYLKEIDDMLPTVPGKGTTERLENAYLLAKKGAMREAGKTEMAFALHQQKQAITSGGGASSSKSESSTPLTADEREVAQKMNLTHEEYAKSKAEKR